MDEDKVLDFKYVRHTPKLYKCSDIDGRQDDVKTDGSLKMSLGQINIIFISKMLQDCEVSRLHFCELYICDNHNEVTFFFAEFFQTICISCTSNFIKFIERLYTSKYKETEAQ